MIKSIDELMATKIDWEVSAESPYIFQAEVESQLIRLRLNDFPEESLCTLLAFDQQIDLDDFPQLWSLPRHRQ